LPAQVDPRSAVHEVQGDELVIRLQRAARAKRRGAGAGAIRPQRTAGTAATAREQTITARQRANGATPRRAASAIDGSSLNVQTKRVKRIRAIA